MSTAIRLFVALCSISAAAPALADTVTWNQEDLDLELDAGTAIDFGFEYEVALDEGTPTKALWLRVCENASDEAAFCSSEILERPAQEGAAMIRYGIDPSQYGLGHNVYTLTLYLGTVARDQLTIDVTVY